MTRPILILAVSTAVMAAAMGCGANGPTDPGVLSGRALEERIVGTWKMTISWKMTMHGGDLGVNLASQMTFRRDGKVEVTSAVDDGPPMTISGAWKVEEDRLTLKAPFMEEGEINTYTCSIEGNTLTLTNLDGEVTVWKKV
jgi:hypothetical protein